VSSEPAPSAAPALAPARHAHQPAGRRKQWTAERVLEAAVQWARETGGAPYAYEWDRDAACKIGREHADGVRRWIAEYPRWPSTRTATALWGSWRALLTEAGLPSAPPLRLTLSERLAAAEQLRGGRARDVAELIGVSESTVRTYWNAGRCPSCGGPKVTPHAQVCANCTQLPSRQPLSPDVVIGAITAWASDTGAAPLANDWLLGQGKWAAEYPRWPTTAQVRETFGTWNAAITAAGYTPRAARWSAAQIVAAAKAWSVRHDRPPRLEDWRRTARDRSHPSSKAALQAFGGWNDMLLAAGLPISHRTWTRDQIMHALSAWITTHGRTPTMADWNTPAPDRSVPTAGCVADHFGSWNAMLIAAGHQPTRRYWNAPDIIAACVAFEQHHGHRLRIDDLRHAANQLPSLGAVRRHIGTHGDLLAALDATRGDPQEPNPAKPDAG
jgi:hypothetical protein